MRMTNTTLELNNDFDSSQRTLIFLACPTGYETPCVACVPQACQAFQTGLKRPWFCPVSQGYIGRGELIQLNKWPESYEPRVKGSDL